MSIANAPATKTSSVGMKEIMASRTVGATKVAPVHD